MWHFSSLDSKYFDPPTQEKKGGERERDREREKQGPVYPHNAHTITISLHYCHTRLLEKKLLEESKIKCIQSNRYFFIL